jgi:hypothetical protein
MIKQAKYTMEQMVVILKTYQANGNNLKKTADEVGISRTTLRKWVESMGPQVFNHNAVQDIVFKVDEQITEKKKVFDNEVLDAKLSMLRRVVKQIPKTKDMDQLTRGLKVLNELDKDVRKLNIPDDGDDVKTVNYITMVTNAIINPIQ